NGCDQRAFQRHQRRGFARRNACGLRHCQARNLSDQRSPARGTFGAHSRKLCRRRPGCARGLSFKPPSLAEGPLLHRRARKRMAPGAALGSGATVAGAFTSGGKYRRCVFVGCSIAQNSNRHRLADPIRQSPRKRGPRSLAQPVDSRPRGNGRQTGSRQSGRCGGNARLPHKASPAHIFMRTIARRKMETSGMGKKHHGKTAVISGAASGIGQASAVRLAEEGAQIVIADRAKADETLQRITAAGGSATAGQCDISDPASVAKLKDEVEKGGGRCDILVNNAGIYPMQSFDEITFEDWRRVLSVNLDSMFLMAKAFARGMRQRGWGRIINLASDTVNLLVPDFVHYITSKAGVIGFTRSLATELGPQGVTVNAIAPGLTRPGRSRGKRPAACPTKRCSR